LTALKAVSIKIDVLNILKRIRTYRIISCVILSFSICLSKNHHLKQSNNIEKLRKIVEEKPFWIHLFSKKLSIHIFFSQNHHGLIAYFKLRRAYNIVMVADALNLISVYQTRKFYLLISFYIGMNTIYLRKCD
jgi:hypothetical protein